MVNQRERSLKELMDSVMEKSEENNETTTKTNTQDLTNGKTHRLKTAIDSLNELFEKIVPCEYSKALPKDVPQLKGFKDDGSCGVCFRGNTGIGKTYAATALARMIVYEWKPQYGRVTGDPSYDASYFQWHSTPYLLAQVRDAMFSRSSDKETEIQIINRLSSARVLLLDDLGAEKTTEFTGATLYTILSRRRNYKRMTIVTTNQTISDIREWEPRIASRLAEMQTINLPNRDRRLKK